MLHPYPSTRPRKNLLTRNTWCRIRLTDGSKLMIGMSESTAAKMGREMRWIRNRRCKWCGDILQLLSLYAPVSSTSICHVGQHMAARSWRGIGYWLFNLGYFPCTMGVADSILPRTYTWFFTEFRVVASCGRTHVDSLIAESVKERVLLDLIESLLDKLCGRLRLCPPKNDATAQYGDRGEFCHCSLRSL